MNFNRFSDSSSVYLVIKFAKEYDEKNYFSIYS